jgi:hypothetical protein
MTNYFEDIKLDYEELRQKKELLARQKDELIELRRKNKEAYMNMLDELHKNLDELVAIQLAN